MTNRTNLAQLGQMSKEQVAGLPIDHLSMLLEDVAALKAEAKAADGLITNELDRRFGPCAETARKAAGKDTGTVTLPAGEFKVEADLPKRVAWDQALLAQAVEQIKEWGEDPAELVTVEVKVSETKYNAWPEFIRKIFDPARTVGVGSPTYKIKPAGAAPKRRAA